MSMSGQEELPRTADRLEQALEDANKQGIEIALRGGPGGPLNTFLGTEELRIMGGHLLEHMRDEAVWSESEKDFEPVDMVIAAQEVANDHVAGKSTNTNAHITERQPMKMAYGIFINFWLPHLAQYAYGDQYAEQIRSILEDTR